MKEAFELIRKKDVLEIIHSHSCNTARIEEGVLNLPVVSVLQKNDKIKERINDVAERMSHGAEKFDYDRGAVDAYKNALSIVSEVEAECGNGWIPVEKAIPEDGQPIIATFTDGSVYQVNFKLFLHENPEYAHNHNVIAWMPLPEAYKPEKGV